jgi:autotransporter translocation and assembly factor TamB
MADAIAVKKKRLALFFVAMVVFGIAAVVLRGPYISNTLKKVILPELEMACGRQVTVRRIYLNLFPLFAEARDVKVFDDSGNLILSVPMAKAYVNLSGLVSQEIIIRRLVIKDPELVISRKQAEVIIRNISAYLARERKTAVKVKIRTVEVRHGNLAVSDESQRLASRMQGLNGEIIIGNVQKINASSEKVIIKKGDWPEITADVSTSVVVKGEMLQIRRLVVRSFGSTVSGSGEYAGKKGTLKTRIELFLSTVKRIFNLERDGTGKVSATGTVTYLDRKIGLDLKVSGNFYLQTLMELLKVKDKIEGYADVKGEVKGPLDDLRGQGTLKVRNGDFYDVAVDSLKCNVAYTGGQMRFTAGVGRLYNGRAKVAVMIHLPVVNFYTVAVDFEDVDSAPAFKLIGWDPGVEPGKVKGSLETGGALFNPAGRFEYRSLRQGKDMIGRIREITGGYRMQNGLLTLSGLKLDTGRTQIGADGTVDIGRKILDLDGHLKTADITDVTLPYYGKLKGAGDFRGRVTGSFDDPVISGHISIAKPVFEQYAADAIAGDVTYKKEQMTIKDLSVRGKGETLALQGETYFRKAQKLFDLSGAEYQLRASLRNADMGRFVKIFYSGFEGTGNLNADIRISGRAENPQIAGSASVENASVYSIPFDAGHFTLGYSDQKLRLANATIIKGKSSLSGDAEFGEGGTFVFKASSDRLRLTDVVDREIKGDAVFSMKAEGGGTLDNPSVSLRGKIIEGVLRGRNVGSGSIEASIRKKNILVSASMINNGIRFTGKGRFERDIPWEGRIDIGTGRYDPLISAFLKDVPEDLVLSLNGTVLLRGDRHHIAASAALRQLTLSMYGYSFSNEREIRMELTDHTLELRRISLRSGDASLSVDGSLVLGRQYNLVFEGKSALSPFKSLSSKIGVLRGDADFVLAVSGDWDNPQINGGVTLANGSFGMKEFPYRLSSLNGYVYIDNDRIVMQRLNGKMGGGDVDLSGIVYLKKFSFRRFYVDARLTNITIPFSNEFSVNFGGDLLLRGTTESRTISGDITINRARYRERVEWKSWLLKTKRAERFKGEISNIERTGLDVKITGNNILVDNNIARAAVGVDMVLRGSIYRPVLLGRIETTEGTVYFRNNDFRILHASADFTDPNRMNPYFMISADTLVKGYKITMNLDGQFDHFNVSFSSDPVLKEMDILSLLAVGQTGTEMKGLEGSIGASEATGFVTGKLQDVIEERLKTITGLDRFQIDPYVSKITGTIEPRVTVSKRLLGDKMYVTYATAVGSKEEQIIKLEYFLTKKMSLVGVRDERGIIGGDVLFRFRFK